MKTKWGLGLVVLVLIIVLCACGSNGAEVELSQDFVTADGNFSISTPDDWDVYEPETEELDLIFSAWNYDTAFVKVYFYDNMLYDYPIDDVMEDMKIYYAENMIGNVEETTINELEAYYLQYSMVDLSETGDEFNYHGYEYFVDTPYGVVEIDINYAQSVIEGKFFDPSEDDLTLLRRIAETFEEN